MKIVCAHPSSELYGSDRSFAAAVSALASHWPTAKIDVIFPSHGPLENTRPFDQVGVQIRDMWILRRKNLLHSITLGLPRSIRSLFQAWHDIRNHDLIYIDTIVVFDFILLGRFARKPVVIHVREIPTGIEMHVFRKLLIWSKASCLFNSEATRSAFDLPKYQRTEVIYNGFVDPGPIDPPQYDGKRPLRLLTIGRVNGWKGQEILVAAIGNLNKVERSQVEVRIVGGVYADQEEYMIALERQIDELGLGNIISMAPFENDPSDSFLSADIIVVPSRKPEPFGRVAIEAMAFARPVIATNHGGLVEIVLNGETGDLVEPNNSHALTIAIRSYLEHPLHVSRRGAAARERFSSKFTMKSSDFALCAAFDRILSC